MDISQELALKLIAEDKRYDDSEINIPFLVPKNNLTASGESGVIYNVDVAKNRFFLKKLTFQHRVYTSVPLIRIDLDTKTHRNPDGELICGNHIHIYKEGAGMSWAYPLDADIVKSLNSSVSLLDMIVAENELDKFRLFNKFCHFINEPKLTRDMNLSLFNIN